LDEAHESASAPGGARCGARSGDGALGGARPGDGEIRDQPVVPQLVSLGFDDNAYADGIEWALAMMRRRKHADDTPLYASFFVTAMYLEAPKVVAALKDAVLEGHEIGNHTFSHAHGGHFSVLRWQDEIGACLTTISRKLGATVRGFRAPFLEWNEATFAAVRATGLEYDCSVYEEQIRWPWRRDDGVWSLPVLPVVVPAELHAQVARRIPDFDGTVTGFDYNLWVLHQMSAGEVMATLAHTLDERLAGNRAPLCLGMHSDLYSRDYAESMRATLSERRLAIEEFLDYALSRPDVRVVSHSQVLDYVNGPTLLS